MSNMKILSPLMDDMRDIERCKELFGAETAEQMAERAAQAEKVHKYLAHTDSLERWSSEATECYESLMKIMTSDRASNRLALYIPFNILSDAKKEAIAGYVPVWQNLLNQVDKRGDFACGEPKDSKDSGVVQALRIAPWLIISELISGEDLLSLAKIERASDAYKNSIFDTVDLLEDWELIDNSELNELKRLKEAFDNKRKNNDAYSRSYNKGLGYDRPIRRHVESPWYTNVSDVKNIAKGVADKSTIAVVSYPELYGYTTGDTEPLVRFYKVDEILEKQLESSHSIADVFYAVWVGPDATEDIRLTLAKNILRACENESMRMTAYRDLEYALLQRWLMPQAYHYAYRDVSKVTVPYKEMDGYSAFYDPRFRRDACMLYSKYIFLPRI